MGGFQGIDSLFDIFQEAISGQFSGQDCQSVWVKLMSDHSFVMSNDDTHFRTYFLGIEGNRSLIFLLAMPMLF